MALVLDAVVHSRVGDMSTYDVSTHVGRLPFETNTVLIRNRRGGQVKTRVLAWVQCTFGSKFGSRNTEGRDHWSNPSSTTITFFAPTPSPLMELVCISILAGTVCTPETLYQRQHEHRGRVGHTEPGSA